MAAHAARTNIKMCEVSNFWYFFKKSSFHVFSRRVNFPFKCGKASFRWSRSSVISIFLTPHRDIDFSKLVHLCLVKIFSLISTLESKEIIFFMSNLGLLMQFFHGHVEITVIITCHFLLFDYKNICGYVTCFWMSPNIAVCRFLKTSIFGGTLYTF